MYFCLVDGQRWTEDGLCTILFKIINHVKVLILTKTYFSKSNVLDFNGKNKK